eukprot:CAMPEP_0198299916 /NCGR_PEP_ID=MMETSP1449-20131203/46226_1 /TAXON_ID=420275 /ORGANISM="Attheya septentrionalis, Strain CCMP2084" /LENGTH=375 /DNA_ID=CAMNT_0044001579 /DNA_START=151 /DNA_END=1278 /DNA_ORIENTATION=-
MTIIVGRALSRPTSILLAALQFSKRATCLMTSQPSASPGDHYRHDGVRITHDPFAPGMAEKYGTPGQTNREGFDPYADSVGAGIYGGIVKRQQESGEVIIGQQFQNHNPRPGPVYAGGGYTPSTLMLDDVNGKLIPLLDKFPDLVNDMTTGGAQPLHMCGMSRNKQNAVRALAERGADLEALDTYGMTPLHRMASNNLAAGAKMLLEAGADVSNEGKIGASPMSIAKESAAHAVMEVLKKAQGKSTGSKENIVTLNVMGSKEVPEINGDYFPKHPEQIPSGFDSVCETQSWNTKEMWAKLNGLDPTDTWFAHSENESYIYWNRNDRKWWIDGPDGDGVWIVDGPSHAPPAHGWMHVMKRTVTGSPMVRTFRDISK